MKNLRLLLKQIYTHKYILLLVVILLLSAFLRLYRISDYMTFLGDEGRDLLEVKKILSGNLVFLGPRSSAADFYYGPIYFYFITPFLWLFRYDPAGPAVFIGLVGIATVYLVYWVGKELSGTNTGLFAAALYTVSPLVIAYSRSSWNPNPMPFVSLLLLFTTYRAIKNNSWKQFLFSGILMGIAMQLQYLALFLAAITAAFILLGLSIEKKTRNMKSILKSYSAFISGFIIGWSPFLAFELKHSFPNLKTIIHYIFSGSADNIYVTNAGFMANIQAVFFKLFARLITRFPPPEQVNVNENFVLLVWQTATIVLGFAAIAYLFHVRDRLAKLLLLLWLFVGIFLFGFYKKEIYDYYLGFMFPLPFLLVGNLLAAGWNYSSRAASIGERSRSNDIAIKQMKSTHSRQAQIKSILAIIGKLFAIIVFSVLFLFNLDGNPFKNIPNRQKDQVKQIAQFVISKSADKPYNFALLTKGNSDHAYRYYLEILGHPPAELKNDTLDSQRKSVTDQLLVVCEDQECQPLGNGLWEVAGFGRAEIAGKWQVSVVKVFRLIHY